MGVMATAVGILDETLLEKRDIVTRDDEDRKIIRTEYLYNGEVVKADVLVIVKKWPELFGDLRL